VVNTANKIARFSIDLLALQLEQALKLEKGERDKGVMENKTLQMEVR